MQKFSFLTDTVYFQANQEVEIHSKVAIVGDVTLQLQSSFPELDNKIFQIASNSTFIFKFKPKGIGIIKAIRIWGAVWDFNGFLDISFRFINNIVEKEKLQAVNPIGTSDIITKTIYDFNGWSKIELFKNVETENQIFEFWLSEHENASYTITCNDSNVSIENPFIFFTSDSQDCITVSDKDLKELIVCLKIYFGGAVYELQGSVNVDELEQELYMQFASDSKIRIYRQNDTLSIYSDYTDRNKMKFQGVDKTIIRTFSNVRSDKKSVKLKFLNNNWSHKDVTLNIVANGLVRRPSMLIHFENKKELQYSFEIEKDLIVGEKTKLYLNCNTNVYNKLLQFSNNIICENSISTQEEYNKIFWYVEANTSDDAIFSVKDIITETFAVAEKSELLDLLYSVQITKEEVILKVFLNAAVDYDYDYDISFQDKISKENIDYKLTTSLHQINAGQIEKKERISWTTAQSLRAFNIVLDGKVIPISWFDRTAYPNIISLRNSDNVRHFINRAINRPLTLQFLDGQKIDTIVLNANQTDWQYQAKSDIVVWQVYDQDYLIFEQTVSYLKAEDQKPILRLIFDDNVNSKSLNYLTLKLDWPVKYDVDLELIANSNTDLKISGKYRIKADQTELKFKLTPLRLKNKPAFLSLQITSANVEYDNKKYNVIIN